MPLAATLARKSWFVPQKPVDSVGSCARGGAEWAGGLHEPTGTQATPVHAARKGSASPPHLDVAKLKSTSS